MKRIFFAGLAALSATTMPCMANADSDIEGAGSSAFRLGVGAGKVKIKADDVDLEDTSTAWELFGGWELNRYLAFEAGYFDAGEAKDTIGSAVIEADPQGYMASILGSLPVTDSFSIYARAGYPSLERR